MARDLKKKVVVITGGAEGIGYEIADKYLQEGARTVILLDINEELGIEAANNLSTKYGTNKAVFIKCDVTTDQETVSEKIFSKYNVDILVNNAGVINDTVIKKLVDINVTAVLEWSLKFWHHMKKYNGGNGGTIINISSIYGFRVDPYHPTYQSSKFAVMGFTKSLGHVDNYERSGVRVIVICPGFTETRISQQPVTWEAVKLDAYKEFAKSILWQKLDVVGDAAVEIYKKAESGTAWLIEGGKPIVELK